MYYVDDLILGEPVSFETLAAAERYANAYGWEIRPECDVPARFQSPLSRMEYMHG